MPEPSHLYCIGADPASGKMDSDWAVAVVVDCQNGSVVATWRGHLEPTPFAEVVLLLGEFYGQHMTPPQAFLVPETNNHGIAFLEAIRAMGYYNIYCRQVWDRIEAAFTPQVGFCTSLKTKPILIKRGREALSDPRCRIRDKVILEEASTFIRTDAGKEEAMDGEHDDALMAFLLALEGRHVFYVETATKSAPETDPGRQSAAAEDRRRERTWVWDELKDAAEASAQRFVHYMGP